LQNCEWTFQFYNLCTLLLEDVSLHQLQDFALSFDPNESPVLNSNTEENSSIIEQVFFSDSNNSLGKNQATLKT